jgi:hypothetical protein
MVIDLVFYLTPRSRVLPEKLTGPQLVKQSLHFRQPEGLLPHSQKPTTKQVLGLVKRFVMFLL